MPGIIVNKRCGLALARAVADTYAAHGFDAIELVQNRGLFQILVRGHKVTRMTPTGPCSSFGSGVPVLSRLCPELYQLIETDNQQHKEREHGTHSDDIHSARGQHGPAAARNRAVE